MVQQLSVKEATQFTGKSESTIKRLIREVTADPTHAERDMISPAHDEVEKRREAGEPYTWKISQALLTARYGEVGKDESDESSTDQSPTEESSADGDRIINVLEKTITVLESELGQKNQQIAALQERQREQNLLMKNLQEQLLLTTPTNPASPTSEAVSEQEQDDEKGSEANTKPGKTAPSFWHREFHIFGPKRGQ